MDPVIKPKNDSAPFDKLEPQILSYELTKFLQRRKIDADDHAQLTSLLRIIDSWDNFTRQKILIGIFHNFFLRAGDRCNDELERCKSQYHNDKPKNWNEFIEILIFMTKKYGHYTTEHLMAILEQEKTAH